jgi:hypothetical protein
MREHSRVQSYRSRKIVVHNVIDEDTTQHSWKQYNTSRHNGT